MREIVSILEAHNIAVEVIKKIIQVMWLMKMNFKLLQKHKHVPYSMQEINNFHSVLVLLSS